MLRLALSIASNSLSTFKGNKIEDSMNVAKKNPSSLLGCASDFTVSIPPRFRTQRKVCSRPRNGNCRGRNKGRSNAVHSRINIQRSNERKSCSTGFLKSRPISPGCDPARMAGAQGSSKGRPAEDQGVMITVMEIVSWRPL